ncbi:MAG: D-allose ABC transporter permease [Verrucomicrobia bacterium]|nr:D-allose ABC transporter permease [Verrucomicrobiota bacterium]
MNRTQLATFWERYGTFCILVLIIAVFSALSPAYFFRPENILQIGVQSAITVLTALGEFFAILIAGIDLSVGSILAITGIVTAKLMVAGLHPVLAVLGGGVLMGMVLGAINGALVNFTGLHPFIITLGTNAIFRGLTFIISGANPVFGFPYEFVLALTGNVGFVPAPVLLALCLAVVLWFVTTKTRLGRNIYAMGGNREAAYFSGIDIKLHTLVVFIISGFCSGLAGVLSTARTGAAEPLAGQNFETFAIASAIIGGTSFFGGRGRIPSVVVGGLIIGTISNGLNMLHIQTFYQLVVMGSLIIAAVSIDRLVGQGR